MKKHTNSLIHESSPYLLQHAHNPVDWVPWSEDVFKRAAEENKLVLISVGYSSCHWCHVMEHECFEDEAVAAVMNRHFINVKVDREERPDVDQVYMTAVQLMTQRGGWPLNCFTLPDGRPLYGGTYFPKEQWLHVLGSIRDTWDKDPHRALEYAEKLHEGIQQSELIAHPSFVDKFEEERLHELVLRWSRSFDSMEGGSSRAPKFPLPNNYEFLLRYGVEFNDEKILRHVELTLDKMAMGGIYDQVGGGFTRYSVDLLWKVPHFEKMLYDNGQLLSLYAQACKYFKKPLYRRTVKGIAEWLEREMKSSEGAYYSALDADSEGEEGKFYCWTISELEEIFGDDIDWVKDLYNLNQRGYWEEEKYILLRTESDDRFSTRMGWSLEQLEEKITWINELLLAERNRRVRPGLDDKCLTSWNAMVLSGLCDAYAALGNEDFLQSAGRVARWIRDHQLKGDDKLWRTRKNGVSSVDAFLEDYAHVINGFISYYSVTFDEQWVDLAYSLMETVLHDFYDENSGMCWFTPSTTSLIARKMELNDNVIPASNSVMAHNFRRLGEILYRADLKAISEQMLANVYDGMEQYGSGYSNWASLLMDFACKSYVIALTGTEDTSSEANELRRYYLPQTILVGGKKDTLPVLSDKEYAETAQFFVCFDGTCLLPTRYVQDIIKQIRSN